MSHRRLREARIRAGYTNASEFARLIGVTPTTIYRLEREQSPLTPSTETVKRWAAAVGCTVDYLLGSPEPNTSGSEG
jgi:transcriptional regulator with XRE-family HTH domain